MSSGPVHSDFPLGTGERDRQKFGRMIAAKFPVNWEAAPMFEFKIPNCGEAEVKAP